MRLLFDQNISPNLVGRLSAIFPESSHVEGRGLGRADDSQVWIHAETEGFTLVTKDSDFNDMSLFEGFPPKVIWLRVGNSRTVEVEFILGSRVSEIMSFGEDSTLAILELTGGVPG